MNSTEYGTIHWLPGYRFGRDGSVWSERRKPGKWVRLKCTVMDDGYINTWLIVRGIPKRMIVHRMILEAFVGPCPAGCEARHFPDRDRSNNAVENLAWGTRSQNFMDKWPQGTMPHGEGHGMSKLTEKCVEGIRAARASGRTYVSISKEFNITPAAARHAATGKTWAWLKGCIAESKKYRPRTKKEFE